MGTEGTAESADARRARQVTEVEALLLASGVELYRLAVEQARWQLGQGAVAPGLAGLLAQARASMLRGLRLPERITRGEAPTATGPALAARREGGAFDFAAFARLFLSLAASGGPGAGAAGADGPELALDPPGSDDKAGGLSDGAGA